MALSAEPGTNGRRRVADVAFAAILVLVGLSAAFLAAGYPRESAVHPAAIGLGLAGLGGLIIVRSLLAGGGWRGDHFAVDPTRLTLGLLMVGGYVAALTRFGFVLPSLLLAVLMPAAAGYRRPLLAGLAGMTAVAAIVTIFVVALSRPLPADPVLQLLGLQR
jgi:hypothetical protein